MIYDGVSIVVINFNGLFYLKNFYDSLQKELKNITSQSEIIFVDNNSSDGSVKFVNSYYKNCNLILNKKNYGYAKGVNIGVLKAKYQNIIVCNNDIEFLNNSIKNLLKFSKKNPKAMVIQPKPLRANSTDLIDSCGSFWTDTGFLYHYGLNKSKYDHKYIKPFRVFSIKGMCFLTKKDFFINLGMFDNDFWCFYEESDFCHRTWLSNNECWYIPDSEIIHHIGGTSSSFDNDYIQFHSFKNRLHSFLINFEIKTLLKFLPVYLILNIIWFLIFLIKRKFKLSFVPFLAILWNIKNIKKIFSKRYKIKKIRKMRDYEIFFITRLNPHYNYFSDIILGRSKYLDKNIPNANSIY